MDVTAGAAMGVPYGTCCLLHGGGQGMLLPRAVTQSLYQCARLMAWATRAASAQARMRPELTVPITGAMPAGCFISHPRSTDSPELPYSPASSATSSAVAASADVGLSGSAP